MADEIVSLVVIEALPGKEEELLAMLREFYTMMTAKGYSHESLHRDLSRPGRFFHVRYWQSEEMRSEAQADPDVHRYWQRLPGLCAITTVYESLETVFET